MYTVYGMAKNFYEQRYVAAALDLTQVMVMEEVGSQCIALGFMFYPMSLASG